MMLINGLALVNLFNTSLFQHGGLDTTPIVFNMHV